MSAKESEVSDLEADHDDKADAKKRAKEALDVGERELRELIRSRSAGRGKAPQPKQQTLFEPSANGKTEDDWRSVPLASLSLPKGLLDKLANPVHKSRGAIPPITTMGELTDYQQPEPSGWTKLLVDLKGVGIEAANKVAAACEQFWSERNATPTQAPQKADGEGTAAASEPGAEAGVGAEKSEP